jgi:hypothetical protein
VVQRDDRFVDLTVIVVNVVGWMGMALLIGAYALVTTGRILGPSLTFQVMNLLGGAALMINSAYYGAWPSAVLNVVWVVIGVVGLNRARLRRPSLDPASAGAQDLR